jgi:ribonuclease P protein component
MESVDEAHLSAEQAPPAAKTWFSSEDADQERKEHPAPSARQRSQATHGVIGSRRFRPQDRIRKRSEYKVNYARGRRIRSTNFTLFVMRNALGRPRLGITVTRRVGGAVRRNRAKRLIREIFRRHKSELLDVDIVVNGRVALPDTEYRSLEAEFLSCTRSFRKGR